MARSATSNQRLWLDSGQILRHEYEVSVAESLLLLKCFLSLYHMGDNICEQYVNCKHSITELKTNTYQMVTANPHSRKI